MLDISKHWYRDKLTWLSFLLLPISWLFGLVVSIRRWCYRVGLFKTHRFPVPVIVVGNITVGGTGKTPFVIQLAKALESRGYRPGIVSRGYTGKTLKHVTWVTTKSNTVEVGEEAILIAKQTSLPVVVARKRASGVAALIHLAKCNLIISDDGLQHYALGRSIEVTLVDQKRQFGNQRLLPAGPLREPVSRLNLVDAIVYNGGGQASPGFQVEVEPVDFRSIQTQQVTTLDFFKGQRVHAVAGIGNPDRFFATLDVLGVNYIPHRFPDHYHYQLSDLHFRDDLPIVMTEKDAIKCKRFTGKQLWYLTVKAILDDRLLNQILNRLIQEEKVHENQSTMGSSDMVDDGCNEHGNLC